MPRRHIRALRGRQLGAASALHPQSSINITSGARNIWVDHCEFWDGQDGNADVIRGADKVTFTFNIFGYRTNGLHNLSNLVASSDNEPESAGKLDITLMFNHFRGAEQRTPRCRYGDIHVVNNLFTSGWPQLIDGHVPRSAVPHPA